jgi:hypothetical protein
MILQYLSDESMEAIKKDAEANADPEEQGTFSQQG